MLDCNQLKESVLKFAGPKYECVECDNVDGSCVITIKNNNDDNYLLNYEITESDGNATLAVNVIDKNEQAVIDDYTTDVNIDEGLEYKVTNSVQTFEALRAIKAKEQKTVNESKKVDTAKFDSLLEDGLTGIDKLSDDELSMLDEYLLSEEVTKDNTQLTIDLCHNIIQREQDAREYRKRNKLEGLEPSSNDNIDYEEALESVSIVQLTDVLITKLTNASENEEDDTAKRIIDDILADMIDISEELALAEI